jgi:hypothetical protein
MKSSSFVRAWWGFIFLFCLALNPPRLWAGPPFETDDPEPTEYGHWEIYFGATAQQIQGQGWTGTVPFLELNYGGLPDIQLSLTEQAAFNAPTGGFSNYGYGDTLAGVKYRFIHEGPELPQVAIFPQVNIPTGDASKGLGAGMAQYLLPLWLQKSWGPWTTYGGAGYWINPGTGNQNWLFAGWEAQRDFGKGLTLGGEVFYHGASTTTLSDNPGSQGEGMGFNLGGEIHFDDVNHVVFSLGRDFIQTSYTFTGYVAYEWTFPNETGEKAQ